MRTHGLPLAETYYAWRRPGRAGRPMLQRFAPVSRRGADLIRKRSICHTTFRLNTDDKPMDFLLFSGALSVYPLRVTPIVRLPRKSPGVTGAQDIQLLAAADSIRFRDGLSSAYQEA